MINSEVWIKRSNDWISGIYMGKNNDNMYKVQINNNIFFYNNIEIKNDDELDSINDLINIPHLNEPSILNGIQIRYNTNKIYTYTGKILISINPFQNLNLYDDIMIDKYKNNSKNKNPHIYQIANNAYKNIFEKKKNQSILVSGESGAGKTHATKLIMEYLAKISGKGIKIKNKVINSNPILEAFGNAKTIHNDNSSRFGKFIKLNFNNYNKLIGASIETYLLEKIRLIHQNKNERNFHIFYQMLKGMNDEEKKKYHLNKKEYNYLNNNIINRDDGITDEEEYNNTLIAFKTLNFTVNEIDNIFKIISGILNLGSINFDDDGNILNMLQLEHTAYLFGITNSVLLFTLCNRNLTVNAETYKIKLTKRESIIMRDSFAMKLYQKLFNYIVKLINRSINNEDTRFIGILDIFGFESIEKNNFEQLCINYTNEQLQNQFNKYIFRLEQEEYKREQINWNDIEFPDNKDILDLIDSKLSILSSLDEECRIPKGSDKGLTAKLVKTFSDNKYFTKQKKFINEKFGIRHYAGEVIYNSSGFCDKNKDIVSNEIIQCILTMPFEFLKNNLSQENISILKAKSLSYQFKIQLKKLISIIDTTETHYIRCLKPNSNNLPNLFNRNKIIDQLKYCGVIEAIRVARSGYAVKMLHSEFMKKYRMIDGCSNLKNIMFLNKDNYQVGLTKIFLKTDAYEKIEDMRLEYINLYVTIIQKNVRCFFQRKKYKFILQNIIIIQSFNRIIIAKNIFDDIKKNYLATIIQSNYRAYIKSQQFAKYLSQMYLIKNTYINYKIKIRNIAAIVIQKLIRSVIKTNRERVILLNKSAIIIQKVIRRYNAINKYRFTYKKIIFIQRRVKRFIYNKNKLIKKNKKLEEKLKNRENKIEKYEEYCKQVSQTIREITYNKKEQNDKINLLYNDIDMYKECISKDINTKVEMMNEIEKLRYENMRIKEQLNKKKWSFWSWFKK